MTSAMQFVQGVLIGLLYLTTGICVTAFVELIPRKPISTTASVLLILAWPLVAVFLLIMTVIVLVLIALDKVKDWLVKPDPD